MDNIQYPNTGSSGWGTKINNNFKEISDTIGSINKDSDGDIGTQLGNINSQLNDIMNDMNGWKVYNDITELGLTSGSETIDQICIAMIDKSILMHVVTNEIASSNKAYPKVLGGTLKVEKLNINRIKLTYSCGGNGNIYEYIGYYYASKFTGWQEIKSGDSGWLTLPLTTGTVSTIQYRKVGTMVKIRGSVTKLTDSGKIIGTLPSGFRPSKHCYFLASTGNNVYPVLVQINTDGTIKSWQDSEHFGSSSIDLDSILFYID